MIPWTQWDETWFVFCRKLIPTGICQMMLPQCGADGRPELSCREDCDQIHRLCSNDIKRFYGALEFYVKQQQIDFSHLNIPTCTDFKYSYEYGKNATCNFIQTLRKWYVVGFLSDSLSRSVNSTPILATFVTYLHLILLTDTATKSGPFCVASLVVVSRTSVWQKKSIQSA